MFSLYSVTSVPNKNWMNFFARCRISAPVHHITDVLVFQTIMWTSKLSNFISALLHLPNNFPIFKFWLVKCTCLLWTYVIECTVWVLITKHTKHASIILIKCTNMHSTYVIEGMCISDNKKQVNMYM